MGFSWELPSLLQEMVFCDKDAVRILNMEMDPLTLCWEFCVNSSFARLVTGTP